MLTEVLEGLHINNQATIIDATLGAGGHSNAIAKAGARVLAIEYDEKMIARAKEQLHENVTVAKGNFRNIKKLATEHGFTNVDGVLFDLGVSAFHFLDDDRGFSFQKPHDPLDMRLNPQEQAVTAAILLNGLREDQLTDMFTESMIEHEARGVARKVVAIRAVKPFETVADVINLFPMQHGGINPATKAMMALRIAVNSELDTAKEGLEGALEIVRPGGRIVVISFHSGEDAIVKHTFEEWEEREAGRIQTAHPVLPTESEVARNPKARSAKLRIFEKL